MSTTYLVANCNTGRIAREFDSYKEAGKYAAGRSDMYVYTDIAHAELFGGN